MSAYETLADLQRDNCQMLIHCKACDKWVEKSPHALIGVQWRPGIMTDDLEGVTIVSVLERLRCACGSREVEWWPKRRLFV